MQEDLATLQNDDVQVIAVSVDSPFANKVWAEQQGFTFPILSDFWPHGAVAQAYGVFNDVVGRAVRGTFVIDREGIVRWKVVNAIPDARDHAEYAQGAGRAAGLSDGRAFGAARGRTIPPRGPSPWKRGVLGGEQVLVCPDCQRESGWQAGLDRCPECDGVRLSKALGVVRCSACGWSGELPAAAPPRSAAGGRSARRRRAGRPGSRPARPEPGQ